MNLEDYRTVFMVGGLVSVLLAAAPALSLVVPFSGQGERFSELWVLGPDHMAEDYPFNVQEGEEYLVYVGVGNHMGCSAYYGVRVKFRNGSEPLPNVTLGAPSPLDATFEYRVFVGDEESWEAPLNFSFIGVSSSGNRCLVGGLEVNGFSFEVDKSVLWDEENGGFYCQLFVELWIYQVESDGFEFHNRFVGLWLNMTGG